MLNLVEPSVTPPNVQSWYSVPTAEVSPTILRYRKCFKDDGKKLFSVRATIALVMNSTFLIANRGHTWCLTQTSLHQMLHLILKCHLHTASENWLWFPTKHMKQDYTGALFKGRRLTFSCLRCKLQINFLC